MVENPVVCCDTSFLFSLYTVDKFTSISLKWLAEAGNAITITTINVYEFENALRLAEWRQLLRSGKTVEFLTNFKADRESRKILLEPCNLSEIFKKARYLSACHTMNNGFRGYDILHVASALCCKADEFLTFDKNQKKLAESEGLLVPL